jgi:hypothetical protein
MTPSKMPLSRQPEKLLNSAEGYSDVGRNGEYNSALILFIVI